MYKSIDELIQCAKDAVNSALLQGVEFKDIIKFADMLCTIKTLEEYQCMESAHDDMKSAPNVSWILNRVDSEIKATEIYYNKYLKTESDLFKQLAREEAQHAELIIAQAVQQGEDPTKISSYRQRLDILLRNLAK